MFSKTMLVLETRKSRRAGRIDDVFLMVQVLEDFLRSAQRLLEDVVDSDQALERLQQHEQRDEEAGEVPAVSAPPLICMRA